MSLEDHSLIRQFNHWRDEIINYADTTKTTIADAMKTPMLVKGFEGEVRAHLLPSPQTTELILKRFNSNSAI
eukprot:3408114-Amphidinium_carterae.1